MFRARLCLFALLAILPATAPASTCPPDSISLEPFAGKGGNTVSTEPAFSVSLYYDQGGYPWSRSTVTESAGYSAQLGHIAATAFEDGHFMDYINLVQAHVSMQDEYTLMGPSNGGPVLFTARLKLVVHCDGGFTYQCTGGLYCSVRAGCASADLGEVGTGNRATLATCENTSSERALSIALTRSAGERFTLRVQCTAEGTAAQDPAFDAAYNRTADIAGDLVFLDLPAGYSVVSCQGYAPDSPVLARPASWGRIKTLYR